MKADTFFCPLLSIFILPPKRLFFQTIFIALSADCITRNITVRVDQLKLKTVFRNSHGWVMVFVRSIQVLLKDVSAPPTERPKNHFMAFELSGYLTTST